MMTSVITRYLEANLLILVGFVLLRVIQWAGEASSRPLSYTNLLFVARIILLGAIALPHLSTFFPQQSFLNPSAQVWHATSMRQLNEISVTEPMVTVGKTTHARFSTEALQPLLLLLFFSFMAALILRFGRASRHLRRIFLNSHRMRRVGRTEIRVADDLGIPFSFWTPRGAYVFLPSHILENPRELMIATRHEIQHHRQRDTLWCYGGELFRCAFVLNPFSHFLTEQLSEIQEFACDEALVEKKNVSPRAYGSCLLRVAETARGTRAIHVGTTCMASSPSGSFLKRRIHHMLKLKTQRYLGKSLSGVVGVISLTAMATVTWASQGLVHDRRITFQEALQLADSLRRTSNFPITVNESVVKELNRYVGTPDGREFVKNALARMENYRPMIEKKLEAYALPRELMALPIMESGYQNLPQSPTPQYSAGVWQFTPQTARNYGMRVDDTVDERLNVEKETDTACRYLGALNFRFQSWQLAVLAYNAGENKIQNGINKTGSKNAWTLIQNGFSGDNGYLPKMMAAILILNNPSIVD